MIAPEPMTVRTIQEFSPMVSVDLLLTLAREQGLSCICAGRGQVDSSLGYDITCPVCHGVGVAAA